MMLSAGAVTSNSASSSRPAVRLLPNPLLPFAIIHLPSFSSRASQVATWQLVLNSARHELTDNPLNDQPAKTPPRSEEHTSELQSLMRISYAVFCLKKKK